MYPAEPPCSPIAAPSASTSGPGVGLPAGPLTQGVAVVAAGHEADLLALGLVGGRQAETSGHVPDLRLGQVAEREPGVGQLILAQAVQEVGLVLVRVTGPQQSGRPVRARLVAGVVAGRDRLALVLVARPTEQRPELDIRVAVHARAGRGPPRYASRNGCITPASNSRSRFMV